MKSRGSKGLSLIEVLVVAAAILPLLVVAWNALVTSRHSETSVAGRSAAMRGAVLLEAALRDDCARLSPRVEGRLVVVDGGRGLFLSICEPTGATAVTTTAVLWRVDEAGFSGRPGALFVRRSGRRLGQVLVDSLAYTLTGPRRRQKLAVDVRCLDPGLARTPAGTFVTHQATFVIALPPWGVVPSDLPSSGNPSGWIEGIDDRFIRLAAAIPAADGPLPSFVARIDGVEYPLMFLDDPATHVFEQDGRYGLRMAFDYGLALRLVAGNEYLGRRYRLAFALRRPGEQELSWFYDEDFYPSPFFEVDGDELAVIDVTFCRLDGAKGLSVVARSPSRMGRAYRLVRYRRADESKDIAMVSNIGDGLYTAFLAGFHRNGDAADIEFLRGL